MIDVTKFKTTISKANCNGYYTRKAEQPEVCDSFHLNRYERVIPEIGMKSDSKLFDINMLVMVGGQERTEDEYRRILRDAGFTLMRVIPTQSSMSIVEAVPE